MQASQPVCAFGWTLIFLVSCSAANAAFVAVEFSGRIVGSFNLPFRSGALLTGYFTYESGQPSGLQSASRPNFVFEIPENEFREERTNYTFSVLNNWSGPGETTLNDGLLLSFAYGYSGGYGTLTLLSSNLGLYGDTVLPATVPPLSQFDAGASLYVIVEQVQPYSTTSATIDQWRVIPGSGLGRPVIFDVQRSESGVSFRFLTEPTRQYAIQVSDNPASTNWVTWTNLGPLPEPVATVHDAQANLLQRFYRIQRLP